MPSQTQQWQTSTTQQPQQSMRNSKPNTATTSNLSRSVAGRAGVGASKWYILGAAATITTLGLGVSIQASNKQAVRAASKATQVDNDRRYQQLLDAYGGGDSLEDLEKAVESYK